ncbi:MAG: hypothetical protein K0S39_3242 [Paenibacillus sp.]|nr:hypothetical protein [Paenibacillus sp.]
MSKRTIKSQDLAQEIQGKTVPLVLYLERNEVMILLEAKEGGHNADGNAATANRFTKI